MPIKFPYGFTLDSSKPMEVWEPRKREESDDSTEKYESSFYESMLNIKTVLLGAEARLNELNVVQVEAEGYEGTFRSPIAVLKTGIIPHVFLDLCFVEPETTFTLIRGCGPVHIVGHHLLVSRKEEDFEDMKNDENSDDISYSEGTEISRNTEISEDMESSEYMENRENIEDMGNRDYMKVKKNKLNKARRRSSSSSNSSNQQPKYRLWVEEPSSSRALRQDPRDGETSDHRQADLRNVQIAGGAPGPSGSRMMQEVPVEGGRRLGRPPNRHRLQPLSAARQNSSTDNDEQEKDAKQPV